jgi:hypothetical protein
MKNLFPSAQIYFGVKAGPDFSILLSRGVFDLKRDAIACAEKFPAFQVWRYVDKDGKRFSEELVREIDPLACIRA